MAGSIRLAHEGLIVFLLVSFFLYMFSQESLNIVWIDIWKFIKSFINEYSIERKENIQF